MGEQGKELIVSAPDLSRLQAHINYPLVISAINDARAGIVPQRASGNYTSVTAQSPATPTTTADMAILKEVRNLLNSLAKNGVQSAVVLSELQRKQHIQESSRKIGSK